MEPEQIEIGKWYLIRSYGFDSNIKGKAVDVVGRVVFMKFYWGAPYRTTNDIRIDRIIGKCKRPSLFSNR